jgi:carbonic anhydrase
MTMHMVHCTNDCTADDDQLAVVDVMFTGTLPESGVTPTTTLIDTLWASMAVSDDSPTAPVSLQGTLIAPNSGFYHWQGSLTTPPCTEGLEWFQAAVIAEVKQSQIDAFWAHIGGYPGNARPTQPLNGRSVDFYVAKWDYGNSEAGPAFWVSLP